MLLLHLLCYFVHLSLSLAARLPSNAALWVSSNGSRTATGLSNHNLGAWPTHLPWSTEIGPDLDLVVTRYGQFAPRDRWNTIRGSLAQLQRHVGRQLYFDDPFDGRAIYTSDYTRLEILTLTPLDATLYGRAAGKALQAISEFFFLYNDTPRELISAQIRVLYRPIMYMSLTWTDEMVGWPTEPFVMPMEPRSHLNIDFEVYVVARDVEESLRAQVLRAISRIREELWREIQGRRDPPINQASYSYGFVTIQIEGTTPQDPTGGVLIYELMTICSTLHDWFQTPNRALREFGAHLRRNGQHIANIFLLFTALDSIEKS